MTFALPSYTGPASGWQLVDYKPRLIVRATADATGTATVAIGTVDPGFMWAVQRAVSSSTSTAAAPQLRLYDGDPSDASALFSGTNTAKYDEAEYPTGALVEGGRTITAVWTGAAAGDVCMARLQVAVLQLVTG